MEFAIKEHYYMGDGIKYDLYSDGVLLKGGLNTVREAKFLG